MVFQLRWRGFYNLFMGGFIDMSNENQKNKIIRGVEQLSPKTKYFGDSNVDPNVAKKLETLRKGTQGPKK